MPPVLDGISADAAPEGESSSELLTPPAIAIDAGGQNTTGFSLQIAERLAVADDLRSLRNWGEAARAYRAVLDLDWELAPIWVQYGHALKESRDFEGALSAYEQALELAPDVADTYLQLGHLLKISGHRASARDAYSRALQLEPKLRDARRELAALGVKVIADISSGAELLAARFFYDISDVVDHFQRARSPTGIQRIVISVVEAALAGNGSDNIRACAIDPAGSGWKLADQAQVLGLFRLSQAGAEASDPEWQSAVTDLLRSLADAPPLKFPANSVLITLGSPWGITGFVHAVDIAKRESNVAWAAYIHDTVPLSFPEYCDGNMAPTYVRWMSTVLSFADKVLTNSESTRSDLLTFVPELTPRCSVVRPNGDFQALNGSEANASDEIKALVQGERYVLFVGTIEPRKNHLLAAAVWRRLLLELGSDEVPVLIFAGKLGWNSEPVLAFAERTANLDGKLKILTNIADADLRLLYRHALFTLNCSHYEGWGLPITESLSFGRVPVVPHHSGPLESGGEHAVFFESSSEPALFETVRGLLIDSNALLQREERIRANRPIRSWQAISDDIIAQVNGLQPAGSSRRQLTVGKTYRFGLQAFAASHPIRGGISAKPVEEFAAVEALKVGLGWHAPEAWGVRTAQDTFVLQFELADSAALSPGSAGLFLYLAVRGHEEEAELRFDVNGAGLPPLLLARMERRVVRLPIPAAVSSQSSVRIGCRQTGVYADRNDRKTHPRKIGVGVEFMTLCRADDVAARLSIVEEVAGMALLGS